MRCGRLGRDSITASKPPSLGWLQRHSACSCILFIDQSITVLRRDGRRRRKTEPVLIVHHAIERLGARGLVRIRLHHRQTSTLIVCADALARAIAGSGMTLATDWRTRGCGRVALTHMELILFEWSSVARSALAKHPGNYSISILASARASRQIWQANSRAKTSGRDWACTYKRPILQTRDTKPRKEKPNCFRSQQGFSEWESTEFKRKMAHKDEDKSTSD